MNVKDINQTKPLHCAPRCTNPLDPVYKVSTTLTTSLHTKWTEEAGNSGIQLHAADDGIHGQVLGSKPRKLQWDNGEPQLSLVREDIAGTVPQRWVGGVPCNIYDPPDVKEVISFHDPHDIPGAQVGSLKKGIEGSRRGGSTNPLNPRYKMLDGDARPQPVPVFDAERNMPVHSLYQSRAQASSLPNLQQRATPQGSVLPSPQSYMPRNASDAALLRRGPTGSALQSPAMTGRSNYSQPREAPRGPTGAAIQSPAMTGRSNYSQPSGRGVPGPGEPGRAYADLMQAQRGVAPQQQSVRVCSGPGTPMQSGRGTPVGYAMPPTQATIKVPNIAGMPPVGGNYGPPVTGINPPSPGYSTPGGAPQNSGPPLGGSQNRMPTGGAPPGYTGYAYAQPGARQSPAASGRSGDGYIPEGYA